MKLPGSMLFLLAGALSAGEACRAQSPALVPPEWEASAVERRGPDHAAGLLLNLRGEGPDDIKTPVAPIFVEMARVAGWDILRLNRRRFADPGSSDDGHLPFVADQALQARRQGYRQVVVAGVGRGGWLALQASTLPDIDAAIGLATAVPGARREEQARDRLAQALAGARARRIAAFFFEDDQAGGEEGERFAAAMRHALQGTRSAYIVVDRPPDLRSRSAPRSGRFVRRYRDCLLQFVRNADPPAGEVECSRSGGYAMGSEIGFPGTMVAPTLPTGANPALAPFWGRWEGDSDDGTYMIFETVGVQADQVIVRLGLSDGPGKGEPRFWIRDLPFRLDSPRTRLVHELVGDDGSVTATLKSATALEYEVRRRNARSPGPANPRILLHKRGGDAADR